ncbi:chorismate synthase [Candidatus Uabimicrobium sp. HlEnr_7]|uniref:chorismate synthase n=1 Tax=Candidatus Uabimicrobium helgolandensis TaxID=3095367 RepID=UPI0035591312
MIRILTAGESHGPMLSAIIEGIPAGLTVTPSDINVDLQRRQKGFGSGGRMRIEKDRIQIISGVVESTTTGGPISLLLENRDYKNWQNREIVPITTPRPGHADLTGAIKYRYPDLRYCLERASARETAMRVAVGAICKKFLKEFSIVLGGYVTQLGEVTVVNKVACLEERAQIAEKNAVRCPNEGQVEEMHAHIKEIMKAQDTLGGVVEVFAKNIPVGLGTYVQYDRRLDAQIAAAMMSIPAIKGVEFGFAFENARKRGSAVHDEIALHNDQLQVVRKTNRAGGLEGGISNGEPIVVRIAMKPISTVVRGFESVNLATGKREMTTYERSDFCALPRVVPIAEAMLALVIANSLQEKIGGDSMAEMKPRFRDLLSANIKDINLRNEPWKFNY